MQDPHMERLLDDVRGAAAELGLKAEPISTEEFREMGRRAWLREGKRFHITRAADGWPLASSWWADADAARDRFDTLVTEFRSRPGACVTLVDEAEQATLATWPEELP